jgi:hypothetical protein
MVETFPHVPIDGTDVVAFVAHGVIGLRLTQSAGGSSPLYSLAPDLAEKLSVSLARGVEHLRAEMRKQGPPS